LLWMRDSNLLLEGGRQKLPLPQTVDAMLKLYIQRRV
jgi:hypothetical protein